jgi:hypothetical protein
VWEGRKSTYNCFDGNGSFLGELLVGEDGVIPGLFPNPRRSPRGLNDEKLSFRAEVKNTLQLGSLGKTPKLHGI